MEKLLELPAESTLLIMASTRYITEMYAGLLNFFDSYPKSLPHEIWKYFAPTIRKIEDEKKDSRPIWKTGLWTSIPINNQTLVETALRYFDQGYGSVFLHDENMEYCGLLSSFALNCLRCSIHTWIRMNSSKQCALLYSEDESFLKQQAAIRFSNSFLEELPVLRDGKICFVLTRRNAGISDHDKQKFVWRLIDGNNVDAFFADKRRVLLSSNCPNMEEFAIFFASRLDIKYLNLQEYENQIEWADCVLYDDGPNFFWKPSWNLGQLYLEFLLKVILQKLDENDISFYWISNSRGFIPMPIPKERFLPDDQFQSYGFGAVWRQITCGVDVCCSADGETQEANVKNGIRFTYGNPDSYERSIFFFGPCTAFGLFSKDEETIESFLQSALQKQGFFSIRIVNCGWGISALANPALNSVYRMLDTPFRHGDIVIFIENEAYFSEHSIINERNMYSIEEILTLPHNQGLICFKEDDWLHFNAAGNRAVAEAICEKVKARLAIHLLKKGEKISPFYTNTLPEAVTMDELNTYLHELEKYGSSDGIVGAIVMNCNPFTLGHAYLVNKARCQVDFLYVFVVEENKSLFPFCERFAMAKAYCKTFDDTTVVPSGRFILSDLTFAAYFRKEELQNVTIIPTDDVQIFGEHIAPCLHITKRFVGEEPFDRVTRQYNETMKELLPEYGIEVVEIPRYTIGDEAVSATKIRRLIAEGRREECKTYVPETTWKLLAATQ